MENKNKNPQSIEMYLAGLTILCFFIFLVLPYSVKNYYKEDLYSITTKIFFKKTNSSNKINLKEDLSSFLLHILD